MWMIVGALSDLGRALTWQLTKRSVPLLLVDQHEEALVQLADELEAKGYTAPLLAAIDFQHLEEGCQQLSVQLAQAELMLTTWVWTGYHLKSPTPMQHISLLEWQTELATNLTYPYWLFRASVRAGVLLPTSQAWFALPETQAFTHAMGVSCVLWEDWLALLAQEMGDSAPQLLRWQLPRVADRIHRRIWPLAPLESFVSLDEAVQMWLQNKD
jgi:hypothetical protein